MKTFRAHYKRYLILTSLVATVILLSFSSATTSAVVTARYYNLQLGVLSGSLHKFKRAVHAHAATDSLKHHFYACRNAYKRTELFIDLFFPATARTLNGPDLLRISEDSPLDSLKPHGFQVIERLLFESKIDFRNLSSEIDLMQLTVNELQKNTGMENYFTDSKIWMATRLAVFRTISMGVTGFDVPISFHAIPETREVLSTVRYIAAAYKSYLPKAEWQQGSTLFSKADAFLAANRSFNNFDRLTFIRNYVNPISQWLTRNSLPYINREEQYPLSPVAPHLFSRDIVNTNFFSPNPDYYPTPQRVALGKRLFYDPILSGNGTRSCASCHKPELAFTDGQVKAQGPTGKSLLRNTPTLWNAALQTAQFYDVRARGLERQMDMVVHNPEEMDGSVVRSLPLIKADTQYARLFVAAYHDQPEAITEYNIGNAVASYVRSLISFNSRFDRYMRKETDSFTASEKNGFNLFMGKAHCGTCHYAPLFNGLVPPIYQDTESEILGVPATNQSISLLDPDEGKFLFTRHPFHKYAFKTPTVRNVGLTAPYMHNGVFKDLDEVIDFYNDGGGAGRGIDLPTQTLPASKLGLTKKEKQDIIAFLHSLTDTAASH